MAKTEKPAELEGISNTDCCINCDPDRCEITLTNVCGHPRKGGLQSSMQSKPEVVRRYQAARKVLAHAKVETAA